jgi:predicted ATPase
MITSIRMLRFKRFLDETMLMRRLTVLSGTNGGGKTTVIHALLLARLALERQAIDLEDVYGQRLGEATDLLNVGSDPSEGLEVHLSFESEADQSFRFLVGSHRTQTLIAEKHPKPRPAAGSFTYLCADRLGPRDVHETGALGTHNSVGVRGEFVPQILVQHERFDVELPLQHPNALGAKGALLSNVEAWLSTTVRPTEVQATWFPNAGAASIRFRHPEFLGEWVRPMNAGFGLTAAIPIIVAGLTMQGSGLLIIENPESHLHPHGQSEIGRFLARVAACGTQVVVETHSDHVLNGIRIGVAIDQTVKPSDVSVQFLDTEMTSNGERPRIKAIEISANGEMEAWPESFFDQMERDLGKLSRARRGVT